MSYSNTQHTNHYARQLWLCLFGCLNDSSSCQDFSVARTLQDPQASAATIQYLSAGGLTCNCYATIMITAVGLNFGSNQKSMTASTLALGVEPAFDWVWIGLRGCFVCRAFASDSLQQVQPLVIALLVTWRASVTPGAEMRCVHLAAYMTPICLAVQ